ncbi:MAG TPA: hypothetical protein VNN08_22865 [Thermoanaerobaculia bacterium]|nr:hypothetical protein [Thermoanaerobaculia bacterium]
MPSGAKKRPPVGTGGQDESRENLRGRTFGAPLVAEPWATNAAGRAG